MNFAGQPNRSDRRSALTATFACTIIAGILLLQPLVISTLAAQTTSNPSNSGASVQVPRLIRFSGTLTPPSAASGSSNVVHVVFSLYAEETGGTALWQERQNIQLNATGHYTVLLGFTQAEGLPVELFTTGEARWLGVQPEGEPEHPRVMLVSVPFALKAADAETFGGKPPSAYAAAPSTEGNSTSGAGLTAGTNSPKTHNPSQSAISGSGTTNYVPLWTSPTNLGNSGIFQSGNFVGIGTTTPTAPLAVINSSATNPAAIVGSSSVAAAAGIVGGNTATTGSPRGVVGTANASKGVGVMGENTAHSNTAVAVLGISGGIGVSGDAQSSTGETFGVMGAANSSSGTGVYGVVDAKTGDTVGVSGVSASTSGIGVAGGASATTGNTIGVGGTSSSTSGIGVSGIATATSGQTTGVEGKSSSPNGVGVSGFASATTGNTIGVSGDTNSSSGYGVLGTAGATTGVSDGVGGSTNSSTQNASGVFGAAFATTGGTNGVYGTNVSNGGVGVYGEETSTTGTTVGVVGETNSSGNNSSGVAGSASATTGQTNGVFGTSASSGGVGVYGSATSASGETFGVAGYTDSTTQNASGVYGQATPSTGATNGVYGLTNSSDGNADAVYGVATSTSGGANGVEGVTNSVNGFGVWGKAKSTDSSGASYGVYGQSNNGPGVYGTTQASVAILGEAGYASVECCTNAIFGQNVATSGHNNGGELTTASPGGVGGIFENTGGGLSILARVNASQNSFQVDGNGNGLFYGGLQVNSSGTFGSNVTINGNLSVSGNLSKGGGSFKIDDPIDPANKTLSHSFVESPDMMNIYNGLVRLDARGEAWVELPQYFEALNRDFRYQLTSVGAPQPRLYIASEVKGNRFKIAGGKANAKVSWQVTGIRQDAWANAHRIPNEEEKPLEKRGTYLYPELYGAGAQKATEARLRR